MEQEKRIIYSQQFTKEIEKEGILDNIIENWKKVTKHRCSFYIDMEGRLNIIPAYPSPPPVFGQEKGR